MKFSSQVNHRSVFWIALSMMLFLRIPLESWTQYFFPSTAMWIEPIYEIGTYLLTGFLIWWERDQLSFYHIDTLAVILVVFFKPLSIIMKPLFGDTNNPLVFPRVLSFLFFFIAMVILALIIQKKINLKRIDQRVALWFMFGGITGITISVIFGILMIRWLNYPIPPSPGLIALLAPLYQLGYAAVAEEPLFRGFLWGGLRSLGVKELWILLIQASLFTLAHIHLLGTSQPILFFNLIFINAVILGLYVWRSRLLSSSMALHGFANGSIIVQYWVYSAIFQ
jgi:membrane protease YdiL (CAAX protease family)